MQLFQGIFYASIAIALMLVVFKVIEKFLSLATLITDERQTPGYQGGELLSITENRYASAIFPFTMYFLILHVIGFISATIFVLLARNVDPLNWSTLFFGGLMLYTTVLIRKGMM